MSTIQLPVDRMRGDKPPIEPRDGCFIAGGAVRRWFNGSEELSDVDVFAPTADHQTAFLKNRSVKLVDQTSRADTYQCDGVRLQLIKFYHPTVDALFGAFDFNVCQFAWTEAGIFATQDAVIGVLRGHLSIVALTKEFAVDSLRRAFKYQQKGFEPCAGTLRDLANNFRQLTDEEMKAQVELSPKGGSRIVRFD